MSHGALLSSLVRYQLPEFIRADYDTFVAFVEAYYAYLEQTNKATDFGKHLLQYDDVDRTLTEFEEYFVRTFLPLIPSDLIDDKSALIKVAKQFYASKGTEKSFKFFFRALYGEEIDVTYPKDFILRASDGHYQKRISLRCEHEYYSSAEGDGLTQTFRLIETIATASDLEVYINDVLQTTGYTFSLNNPTCTFTTAPTNGSVIKFVYFSNQLLDAINSGEKFLEVIGSTSGATALIEEANETYIGGERITEFFITQTSTANFVQGELITSRYYYTETQYLTLSFTLLSILGSITVVDGGASYNVGDPVLVVGGGTTDTANAVVESIYTSIITQILILKGGAGFREGDLVNILSTPNTGLTMAVSGVDDSETYHSNTIYINRDIISLYENVAVSAADYGFPVAGAEDENTRIIDALSDGSVTGLGPVTNVQILSSTVEFSSLPVLDIESPIFTFTANTASSNTANGVLRVVDLGILGRMNVISGGTGYVPGDEIIFTNITSNTTGYGQGWGAAAEVTSVYLANNGIETVKFQPARIDGTVSTSVSDIVVTGNGTNFLGELIVGDRIEINNESRYINTITSNTSLNVNVAWTKTSTDRKLGLYGRTFVGGERYRQDYLPTVTISSANGSATGANIVVEAIYSDGEELLADSPFDPGQIRSILITHRGSGYTSTPLIDLTGKGNGLATAIAELYASRFTYPGKFLTTDSLLSSDRRLQNRDYYQNFSYVIESRVGFPRYKQILLDLLHPSGMKVFSEYIIDEEMIAISSIVETDALTLERTLDGTVNVGNGSVIVTGTNTTFNVANSLGYLIPGGTIIVNNEARTVNTIINNTSLTVLSTFDYTANDQTYIGIVNA